MTITISAPVGSGKTELATLLGDLLETEVFYEPVDKSENPILDLFYSDQKKYGFLLQIFFLNRRFDAIKEAYKTNNAIIDSSIYTDNIFLRRLHKDGQVTDEELLVYEELFDNLMEEIDGLPYKKAPDLMISIDLSLETELSRIYKRGREFEQDNTLNEYWGNLLSDYKSWIKSYDISPKLVIPGDDYDFVNNSYDKFVVLSKVVDKLQEIGTLTGDDLKKVRQKLSAII